METIINVKSVKNKCPVCLEYYTGYVTEDGKILNGFCSHICEKFYNDMLRPNKLKNIIKRIGD